MLEKVSAALNTTRITIPQTPHISKNPQKIKKKKKRHVSARVKLKTLSILCSNRTKKPGPTCNPVSNLFVYLGKLTSITGIYMVGQKNVTTFNPYKNFKNEHLFEIFFHRCLTKISN